MNALFEQLRTRIIQNGLLTVAQYMEAAMTDPNFGYYTTKLPLGDAGGHRGDFITAPELSQVFGELIGLWSAAVWQSMGEPAVVRLVELGPGRGTLMADALRATKRVPGFHQAAHLHMIDASPTLINQQQKMLEQSGVKEQHWHNDLSLVPEGPMICIANEFFDALPVRQFQRVGEGWYERMVGLNASFDGLSFELSNQQSPHHLIPEILQTAKEGELVETSPVILRKLHTLAARIADQGGAAVIIDYGHLKSAPGETLQALQNHQFAHVLEAPGEQDLTTHIDFAALERGAVNANAKIHGPVEQGAFLNNLGLGLRVKALMDNAASSEQSSNLLSRAERLVDPAQMGSLFKVLGISDASLNSLPALS